MIPWHRLLGLALMDYFHGTGWRVDVEKDLALQRQLLDVLIIETGTETALPLAEPCDGFEALRPHNLLTYKSHHEPLDAWAVEELIGHYVNYRKTLEPRPPPEQFGLYAVCARFPAGLARQVALTAVRTGVYRLPVLSQSITIVVLNEVELAERNALWELFSLDRARVADGVRRYRWRQSNYNTLFRLILAEPCTEDLAMSYTNMADLERDIIRQLLDNVPTEELLRRVSAEDRLKGLPAEERLKGLPAEDRLKGLPMEDLLKALNVALSDEERRLLQQQLGGEAKPH